MKSILIPLLALFTGFIAVLASAPAKADTPVKAILFVADPNSAQGFVEKYHWQMNQSDEWRRFEFQASQMPPGEKNAVSPYMRKPAELIVLSVKDPNGITGKDYYLSPNGIMISDVGSKNDYFEDTHDFYSMLKEEVTNHSSFEKFDGETIPPESPGIVVHYRINENLPNPVWLVNTQKDVNLYDALMRDLKPYDRIDTKKLILSGSFEKMGNFVINLNYPGAPAKYVTVGLNGLRFSQNFTEERYVLDQKKYFDYFHNIAMDSIRTDRETQTKDKKILERGQF